MDGLYNCKGYVHIAVPCERGRERAERLGILRWRIWLIVTSSMGDVGSWGDPCCKDGSLDGVVNTTIVNVSAVNHGWCKTGLSGQQCGLEKKGAEALYVRHRRAM